MLIMAQKLKSWCSVLRGNIKWQLQQINQQSLAWIPRSAWKVHGLTFGRSLRWTRRGIQQAKTQLDVLFKSQQSFDRITFRVAGRARFAGGAERTVASCLPQKVNHHHRSFFTPPPPQSSQRAENQFPLIQNKGILLPLSIGLWERR